MISNINNPVMSLMYLISSFVESYYSYFDYDRCLAFCLYGNEFPALLKQLLTGIEKLHFILTKS